jgi:hypothetical protein
MLVFAVPLSVTRRITAVCSSVNRLVFMGSRFDCGSHSLNSEAVQKPGWLNAGSSSIQADLAGMDSALESLILILRNPALCALS